MPFSNSSREEIILILDVQSSVVRGSLVFMNPSVKPVVIFTYNSNIPSKAQFDVNYLIKTTLAAVGETISSAEKYLNILKHEKSIKPLPHKISAIHYALSSPWIVSKAKVMSIDFDKKTRISSQYISNMIEKERPKMLPKSDEPIELIEQKIFDVKLNGYSVSGWENRETDRLEVSFAVSMAGARMIESFVEACRAVVSRRHVYFHSSLLLQEIGLNKTDLGGGSYALLHIHGEITDVSIIDHDSCIFFGSYPFGVNTLIRQISAQTGNDLKASDSVLTLYTGGKLDSSHGKKTLEVIDEICLVWAKELEKLISAVKINLLPSFSIIYSAWAHDDCFGSVLGKTFLGPKVTLLSIDKLLPLVDFEFHSERRRLTALYAIAIHSMTGFSSVLR